jgi:hypothetical protein
MRLPVAYISTGISDANIPSTLCIGHGRDGTSVGVGRNPLNDPVLEGGREDLDLGEVGASTAMGRMAGY